MLPDSAVITRRMFLISGYEKKIQDLEPSLEIKYNPAFVDVIRQSMNRDFNHLANRWNTERRRADALAHRQSWFMSKNVDSYAVINQVQTIDKKRIISQHGQTLAGLTVDETVMRMIDSKICDTMIEFSSRG